MDFSAPPSHKINNNILIYLTSYGILAPPSPCHQDIVEYCGVVGGIKILQKDNGEPLSAIKIVKYCGACWGAPKSYKRQWCPLSFAIKIVMHCGVWGGGDKILQTIMAPPLSVIKMVKYCGVGGRQNFTKIMAPLSVI